MRSDPLHPSSRCAYRYGVGILCVVMLIAMAFGMSAKADEQMPLMGGDADRGRILFFSCKACHDLAPGRGHTTIDQGPNLFGLFGRRVGTDPDYKYYSAALKNADFIWTDHRLEQWLLSPNSLLPGNKMPFSGIMKAQDRLDLIAYLRQFKTDPPPQSLMTIK